MEMIDLWPDEISVENTLEGPTNLLKEQAALLGQKTNNLVEAEITTRPQKGQTLAFMDTFTVYSSALNYSHILLTVYYPLEFFPAMIAGQGVSSPEGTVHNMPARTVNSKEELVEALKEILSHPPTVKMIQALISRSRS